MLAQPLDEVVVGEAGLALRAPELGRPGVHAEVVVDPVVGAALDRLLRVVLEVVEDGDGGVAGQARRLLADQLERAQVAGREVVVVVPGVRPQVDAAEGVVGDVARDVLPIDDRLDERAHLGLRGRVRARAQLLDLRAPVHREVPVQVETLERRRLLAAHIVGSSTVYSTIQAAVDAAVAGQTVTVDPGNYPESVSIFVT